MIAYRYKKYDMLKILKVTLPVLLAGTLVATMACTPSSTARKPAAALSRPVPVMRGSISVTVPVEGKLVMPEASSLAFGASGNVKDVFVKEGDRVKAGAIMATLEDTAQVLDIKSSNISVQNVLANLYEKVPRLPQFPGNYYDAITSVPTVTPSITQDTVVMWNTDVPPPPPIGIVVTPINTVTGRTSGLTTTVTTTVGTRTVTAAAGTIPGTTEVTTTVAVTNTTISTTLFTPEGITITPVYPGYYPNATSLNSFDWAAGEVANSYYYLLSEDYTAAASELTVALADLEATAAIIEDTINNPQSGLGNTAPVVNDENIIYMEIMGQDDSGAGRYIQILRGLVDDIRQGKAAIDNARELIAQKEYARAALLYNDLFARMSDLGKGIITNYNIIKVRNDTKIYGEEICLYLYRAADEKLDAALKGIETGGLNSQEMDDNLRIARHYMELCNGILGSNDYVLQHGLSLKSEQQYKIDLTKAVVDLGNKRDDFLKTVIMAPFDGIVVNVGVNKNDVLSAMDYSSKTIQVVDTSQVKFQGTVDEIDILKIKSGQRADVTVDAIADKTFPGEVSFISPFGAAATGGVVKFNITILLDPTDVDLKGGLTSSAGIAVSTVENALVLPLPAVTTTDEGSFVTVQDMETGKQEKRKVTTGIQNVGFIQVLTGLNEGDTVIIEDKAAGAPVSTRFGPPRGGGGAPPPR